MKIPNTCTHRLIFKCYHTCSCDSSSEYSSHEDVVEADEPPLLPLRITVLADAAPDDDNEATEEDISLLRRCRAATATPRGKFRDSLLQRQDVVSRKVFLIPLCRQTCNAAGGKKACKVRLGEGEEFMGTAATLERGSHFEKHILLTDISSESYFTVLPFTLQNLVWLCNLLLMWGYLPCVWGAVAEMCCVMV